MIRIRIDDIPAEGRDVDFEISKQALNDRLTAGRASKNAGLAEKATYLLQSSPLVKLHLDLEGSTVLAKGAVVAEYSGLCARCAEDTSKSLEVPVDVVFKPSSSRNRPGAEEEDLNLSFYDGNEIECMELTADLLFLALPYTVLCSESCRGLCPTCGQNLNLAQCACKPETIGDPRLSALRQIKLTH